jgi:hypothetical protein
MGNKIPFESEQEMRMRQRVSAFTGDPETIAEMTAGEIRLAIRAAIDEIIEWITEENGTKFIN